MTHKFITNIPSPETGHLSLSALYRNKNRILATFFCLLAISVAVSAQTITFEPPTYAVGNINGQDGWMKTGPFDSAVSTTSVSGFGSQALRISNSITSGSFGNQTFSKSIVNEAGETSAENAGMSGGTRQNVFQTEFSIASAVPGSEQPGLVISVSPDRGDGARMSYLRFEDQTDGIRVFFDDYVDAYPYGTTIMANSPTGCGGGDNFRELLIATLDRSQPHRIKLVMQFIDGPRNDKVHVFVDGLLAATGTSWEDYFRYCEGNETRTVDSLIMRAAGTAVPSTAGNGFLFDNITNSSSTSSLITATPANTQGWFVSSNTTGGVVDYVNDYTAPSGSGALRLTTIADNNSRAHYRHPVSMPLSAVNEMSFYAKTNSTGPAHQSASYALGVNLDGTPGSFTEIVFEPYWNFTAENPNIPKNQWQKWDVFNGAQLWSSQTVNLGGCSVTSGSGGPPFYTIQGLQSACPSAQVIYQKSYIGSFNQLYDIEVDLFSLNNTVYDFEPLDPTIVKVTPADLTSVPNTTDWFIYNDETDTIDNSLASFIVGPDTPQYGAGSVNISVTGTQRRNIATYQFFGTPLADINQLKFSTYNPSAGNGGGAENSGYLHFNVDFNGTDTWQSRLVFVPSDNGLVAQDVWQEWDAISAGQGQWKYSGAAWPVDGLPGSTLKTWSQIISQYPGVRIRVSDPFLGVRVGEPYPLGYTENIDSLTFGTATGTTIFNFDPSDLTVTVNQALSQPDPTNAGPIHFTVTFSEPVTDFTDTDVVLAGTTGANGVVVTGSGAVYDVAVSGMNADGTLSATIAAGSAHASSGAANLASTSTDNSVYFVVTCNNVSIPTGITTLTNQQVTVPLNVDDVTGRNVISFDYTVTYNSSVLTFLGTQQVGTLSNGMTITVNSTVPGTLVVSGFTATPLTGAGTLINLRFFANGAINSTSPVNFSAFMFNAGIPCSQTVNGSVNVISSTSTGRVTYANALVDTPVPYTDLNGAGSVPVSDQTDLSGNYTLSGFGPGAYTVTPSKTGDVNGINSFDSARISQHVVGLITLNSTQLLAADVSNDNFVNSFDAALIAQWTVLIPNPGSTGTWRFVPSVRNYAGLETAQTNQDFEGILMGEVSGDWVAPTTFSGLWETKRVPSKNAIEVSAPSLTAATGTDLTVPISVQDLTKKGVISYQFDLLYDPTVLEPHQVAADLAGSISEGMVAVSNSPEPGLLKVALFGPMPINGKGLLLNLRFSVIGSDGNSTSLVFRDLMLNDGSIEVRTVDGQLAVSASKDDVSVGGQLLTAKGAGIANARVMITSTTGVSRSVVTNSFGNFVFGGLQSGETYTLNARAKGYAAVSQTVVAADGLTKVDLIAGN